MKIKLTFLGGAGNVTGSRYLVEIDGMRLLVDCGLYQERQFQDRNWDPFPIPPSSLNAVLLTHAHLDHCVVGISGGVDSTLCVLVCARAVKQMGLPAANVVACTLPCFGTSSRTKSNAIIVAEQLGCEVRVIDIGKSVYQHFHKVNFIFDY